MVFVQFKIDSDLEEESLFSKIIDATNGVITMLGSRSGVGKASYSIAPQVLP